MIAQNSIGKFSKLVTALALISLTLTPAAKAQIGGFSQSFETLVMSDPDALGNDGWLVGANVFDSSGGFLYNYFAFPAPNGGPAFSAIASGEGGPAQGLQQLSVYNDYNNLDHGNTTNIIEANVFQERTIAASDVGNTYTFTFDAKLGNIVPDSTAAAFIKTVDPGNGFATTNFLPLDMTNLPTTWGTFSISLDIDASLENQLFQFGFLNRASNFTSSGIFYDNISVAIPEPGSLSVLALGALGLIARRRRS